MNPKTFTSVKSGKNFQQSALVALFGGAAAIAFAPIFVRLSQVEPTATAFWRVTLAAPVLWLWMSIKPQEAVLHRQPEGLSDYRRLALVGFLFAADLTVWHQAIALTSVANATLLPNFSPVFVTLGAWLLFRQKITQTFVTSIRDKVYSPQMDTDEHRFFLSLFYLRPSVCICGLLLPRSNIVFLIPNSGL